METNVKVSNDKMSISREINAPVELVYEMWTNPEHIKHWWGPNGFTNTIYKMDVKEGAQWDFTMHGPDGQDYRSKFNYIKLVKNEKIIIKHAVPPAFQMDVTFIPQGEKTLLTIVNTFESAEAIQAAIKAAKADEGLKQNVDRMENYVTTVPKEKESVIMRQFNAPLKAVFDAWTKPENFAKWWGPKGMDVEIKKFELKAGGMCLYCMKTPSGHSMWGRFVYREINPTSALAFVNSFSDENGGITPNPYLPVWPLETLNNLSFYEHEGKTTLIIKGKPINAKPEEIKNFELQLDNMRAGFAGTFEKLDEFLAGINN